MKSYSIFFVSLVIIFCYYSTFKAKTLRDSTDGLPQVINLKESVKNTINILPPSGVYSFAIVQVVDVNRDGYADIIAKGIFDYISGEKGYTGIIYIIYGRANLPSEIHIDNPEVEIAKIIWRGAQDDFTMENITVGDANGDGIQDFIFNGSKLVDPLALPAINKFERRSYLLIGKAYWQGETIISAVTPGITEIYALEGARTTQGSLSYNAPIVTDLDGDGKDEIVLMYASKYIMNVSWIGQIYIVHGSSNFPAEINAENTSMKVTKIQGDTLFPLSGAISTGDLDGDEKPELIIQSKANRKASYPLQPFGVVDSSLNYKYIYIVYNSVLQGHYFTNPISNLMNPIWGLVTLVSYETPGSHYLYADDINGDGCDDLLICYISNFSMWEKHIAKTYLLFGQRDYLSAANIDKINKKIVKMRPTDQNEYTGYFGVKYADINGDGYKDAIIDAYATTQSKYYILYGQPVFPESMELSTGFQYGTTIINGNCIGCGDINGDGYEDIVGHGPEKNDYIILGQGKTNLVGQTIVKNITKTINSYYHFRFSDSSDFHFQFKKGDINDSTKICLTYYGKKLPDSLQSVPKTDKVVSFIQADLMNMGIGTFIMKCFLTYNDSLVNALGIGEHNLIVSTWNEQNTKWEKLQTTIDTTLNRATFEVEHLSLFALTDKNDSLMTGVNNSYTEQKIPATFDLSQNYPNPFNPQTIIRFQVARLEDIKIRIYNILGQEVKTVISEKLPAGTHEVKWDGTDKFGNKVASGIYIYRMETKAGFVKTRKMVLLK